MGGVSISTRLVLAIGFAIAARVLLGLNVPVVAELVQVLLAVLAIPTIVCTALFLLAEHHKYSRRHDED